MGKNVTQIIEQYNNTPHTALDNITPNQAVSDPKKRKHVMAVLHLNILQKITTKRICYRSKTRR